MEMRRKFRKAKLDIGYDDGQFVHRRNLSLYSIPPRGRVTLEEFETYALARLRALREIESAVFKHQASKKDNLVQVVRKILKNYLPLSHPEDDNYQENIRRDVISHFVLRLAFRAPKDRAWLVQWETKLLNFRIEIERLEANVVSDFLLQCQDLQFDLVPTEEKKSLLDQLRKTYQSCNAFYGTNEPSQMQILNTQYYRVPFTKAIDLVAARKVYLANGYAFVREDDLIKLILNVYKDHLHQNLELAYRFFPTYSDERIMPILEKLSLIYANGHWGLCGTYHTSGGGRQVTIQDLYSADFVNTHYPLCMKIMHVHLLREHHLRHQARIQYGLFIKGIGVSLEDSLEFWHGEIAKKYGEEGWKKNGYAYVIEHSYGQKGKRQSYTPYSCQAIIKSDAQGDQVHGCPYKLTSTKALQKIFTEAGIDIESQEELFTLKESRQYTAACKLFFNLTHPGAKEFEMNHPNKYFDESIQWDMHMKNEDKKEV